MQIVNVHRVFTDVTISISMTFAPILFIFFCESLIIVFISNTPWIISSHIISHHIETQPSLTHPSIHPSFTTSPLYTLNHARSPHLPPFNKSYLKTPWKSKHTHSQPIFLPSYIKKAIASTQMPPHQKKLIPDIDFLIITSPMNQLYTYSKYSKPYHDIVNSLSILSPHR